MSREHIMIWFRLAALIGTASLCFGCWPMPKVDQDDYCFGDLAFTAEITSRNIGEDTIVYGYNVKEMYKGDPMNKPLVGHGESNSCGAQMLDLNTDYLIYAKTDDTDNFIQITIYKGSAGVTDEDVERIGYYDCSCMIAYDYFAIWGWPSFGLPDPTADKCNAPNDFCPRSGFCARDTVGTCNWDNHGECY